MAIASICFDLFGIYLVPTKVTRNKTSGPGPPSGQRLDVSRQAFLFLISVEVGQQKGHQSREKQDANQQIIKLPDFGQFQ